MWVGKPPEHASCRGTVHVESHVLTLAARLVCSPNRVYTRFVEIGRVVLLLDGKYKNKIAVVIDVIDSNRALIDGPTLDVPRHAANFKSMALTDLTVKVRSPPTRVVSCVAGCV